jgi:serine/threonine protein kinase
MSNDRAVSKLISKSLHGKLSDAEQAMVQSECDEAQTKAFAELSRAIQDSVCEAANQDGTAADSEPSLSADAKERMRSSIRDARESNQCAATVDLDLASASQLNEGLASRLTKSRFKLIRKIGEGGLGTVWLARDEKIKRTVAVKEMKATAQQSPKAWARFLREAQITAHLEHPGIVPMYLFGEDADTGQPFYAMRFVGKRTLADAIVEYHEKRKGGESAEMVLHRLLVAFQNICQAIAYVHSKGVIHRDLKPENIALDSFGQAVVLDWGLAKFLDDSELSSRFALGDDLDPADFDRTAAGEIVGTPLFMSPEQAAGDLDNLDERTDIYGLGAILFAILAGNAPHEFSCRSDGGQLNASTLLKAITSNDTPSPRQSNPKVPRELELICTRAMAKRRHSRFETAGDLAEQVELWLAGQSEKPRQYEAVRMEGRELRSNLVSAISDLTKNVRFMANLPPVQGLIQSAEKDREERLLWRTRLSKIFEGLLRTNSNYIAVGYSHVHENGDKAIEMVRVERHSSDAAVIRSIPISRLQSRVTSEFVEAVMGEKPEEVRVAHEIPENCANCTGRLSAGVPVFDERTEEPFGFVTIECDLPKLIDDQVRHRVRAAKQLFLLDESNQLRLHHSRSGENREGAQVILDDLAANLDSVLDSLGCDGEFADDFEHQVYASKIALPGDQQSLTIVLLAND